MTEIQINDKVFFYNVEYLIPRGCRVSIYGSIEQRDKTFKVGKLLQTFESTTERLQVVAQSVTQFVQICAGEKKTTLSRRWKKTKPTKKELTNFIPAKKTVDWFDEIELKDTAQPEAQPEAKPEAQPEAQPEAKPEAKPDDDQQ